MKQSSRVRFLTLVLLLQAALFAAILIREERNKIPILLSAIEPTVEERDGLNLLKSYPAESEADLKKWQEKFFKNRTIYKVIEDEEKPFLSASSTGGSSGLYLKVNFPPAQDLFLSWKWRAKKFPTKTNPQKLSNRREDDFAARVYVIFPGTNFLNSEVIEYLWDEKLPPGTFASSPFSGRVKLFVIRSGRPEGDPWQEEARNIYEDYRLLFQKEPHRAIGGIAIMSDSDNTGSQSAADYKEIAFKTKTAIQGRV